MRNLIRSFWVLFVLVVCACGDENEPLADDGDSEKTTLEVQGLSDDLSASGETRVITIQADGKWKLSSKATWLHFDKTEGTETTEVSVTVDENKGGILRYTTVTLTDAEVPGNNKNYELIQVEPWETQVRIGDPGVTFDRNKFDPVYPQIEDWVTAGKPGGIPWLSSQMSNLTHTFEPGTTATDINAYLLSVQYQSICVLLKNGEYIFDIPVRLYSNSTLIGESEDGVIIKLKETGNISMYNGSNIGFRNLTLKGDYSDSDPDPTEMFETLVGMGLQKHPSIDMKGTINSFVDQVKIINSASHAIILGNSGQTLGTHNTIRDVEIDGAYNKDGYQGYFHIGGSCNLITECKVTRIRHISFQDPTSKNNVFYKNDVEQEVTFHNNDGGDNLVEYNRIVVPITLHTGYCAIMGPWSIQHKVGGKNFIYRNKCLEKNHERDATRNKMPWSDNELYIGPWEVKPADLYSNFKVTSGYPKPVGRTFYPIILK